MNMLSSFMFVNPKNTCLQYYVEAKSQPDYETTTVDNFVMGDKWVGCTMTSKNCLVHEEDVLGYAFGAGLSTAGGESQWTVRYEYLLKSHTIHTYTVHTYTLQCTRILQHACTLPIYMHTLFFTDPV